jgi:NADH-quinone oxidoreductase subunit A
LTQQAGRQFPRKAPSGTGSRQFAAGNLQQAILQFDGQDGSTQAHAPNTMLEQYFPILVFILFGIGIGTLLLVVGLLVGPNRPDPEKLSPYECGFEAFEDARMKFDVRYYLVAILFILFDLEIAFLFPWAVVLPRIGLFGFGAMMIFLLILVVGFVYEWKKGALEWE